MDSLLVQTNNVATGTGNLPSFVTQQASTQKHTSPLISRLLPEILQIIFIYCARNYYTMDDTYGYSAMDTPGWVNISYVSRHWRDVALACPALWSYLFIVSSRWTRELLARSKQAPLKLKVKLVFRDRLRPALDFVKEVTNHLERIQEIDLQLQVYDEDIELENDFYPWLSSRAPRLQNLKIVVFQPTPHTRQFSLFDGDTPALRTLELSKCAVPWYSFKLTGLTTLNLSTVPVPHRKTVAEFLGTLRSIRHLENLYLYDALHATTAFLSESHANTNLTYLSRLSITAPPSTITEFLTCAKITSTTELRLYWDYEDGSIFDVYALLFSVLGKQLGTYTDQGISAPIFRSFVMECTGHPADELERLTFSALDLDLDPLVHHDWGCYNPLKIRVQLGSSVTVDRILTDMSSFISLSNVWSVHVISPPFPADFWRNTLGHLQGLRYIKLSKGRLPDIASVLSLTHLADDDGGARRDGRADRIVLAPALEELVLVCVRTSWQEPAWKHEVGDLQSLCDALATRTQVAGRFIVSSCWGPFYMSMAGEWRGGRFRVATSHRRGRGLRL